MAQACFAAFLPKTAAPPMPSPTRGLAPFLSIPCWRDLVGTNDLPSEIMDVIMRAQGESAVAS
jgi:hypothetical protein